MVWRLLFVLMVCLVANTLQDETNCSKTCSMDKDDPDARECWQRNENYAVEQIINGINTLTGMEIMIQRWRTKTNQPITNVTAETETIVKRVENLNLMDRGPLNSTSMEYIIQIAVQQVLNWTVSQPKDIIDSHNYDYDYVCPVPNDYVCTMWMWLFICITAILALTLIYIAIYVYRVRIQLNKRRLL